MARPQDGRSALDPPVGTNAARLIEVNVPRSPRGVVLVLHGGASRRAEVAVSPTQLSVLRMIPIARGLARAGRRELAVYRLLNSVRGWDNRHTPVSDATWALGEIERRLGTRLPTCLVGHSLGGRAALLGADHPAVVSVVALAPWLYPSESVRADGRTVLILHGSDDRVADPANAARVAENLTRTTRAGFVLISGAKHAMLGSHRAFFRLTRDFVRATRLGRVVGGPVGQVLEGATYVEV